MSPVFDGQSTGGKLGVLCGDFADGLKYLTALLCAVLMAMVFLPAQAQEALSPIYTMVSVDAQGGMTPLGTAVLVEDAATLLTTIWAAQPDGQLMAVGSGGALAVTEIRQPDGKSPLLRVTLAQPSPAQPAALGTAEGPLIIRGVTAEGAAFSAPARHVIVTPLDGASCLLYTGIAGTLPGAVLTDAQGNIAGMAVATYTEGVHRYVAYTAEKIGAVLRGETARNAPAAEGINWLNGFTAAVEHGMMTVDWSGVIPAEGAEDSAFTLFWVDGANGYYTYAPLDWAEGSAEVSVLPGHTYLMWLQQSMTGEVDTSSFPQAALITEAPATQPFTAMDFVNAASCLACTDAAEEPENLDLLPPMEDITAARLRDEGLRLYLQVTNTYQTQGQREALLTVALTAPDGSCYWDTDGYMFLPELGENDNWFMEVTALFRDCEQFTGFVSGPYTLAYYLDGQLGGEVTFVLE